MANLDDLNTTSISEMSPDEAIELMRKIRLSRRTPTTTKAKSTSRKAKAKKLPPLSADNAAELLKILGG